MQPDVEARLVEAIATVANAVSLARRAKNGDSEHLVAAIRRVSDIVVAEAPRLVREIEDRIHREQAATAVAPVDPRELTANPFRLFGLMGRETRWTQWLASMMRPESGPALALLTWRALCETIACATEQRVPQGDNLATGSTWRSAAASSSPNAVHAEWHAGDHGRIDIVIEAPALVAVLELKLGADWHDGPDLTQAAAYERAGRMLAAKHGGLPLALVLLTARASMEHPASWV